VEFFSFWFGLLTKEIVFPGMNKMGWQYRANGWTSISKTQQVSIFWSGMLSISSIRLNSIVGLIWTNIQGIEICRVLLQWGIRVLCHPFRASSIWLYRRFRALDLINKVGVIVGLVLTYTRGSEICRVLLQWGIRVLRHPSRA
jgi:hypothetical protein